MLDDFASVRDFLFLDHVGVRFHSVYRERFGKTVRDESVGM
jgi:hypothetical protein